MALLLACLPSKLQGWEFSLGSPFSSPDRRLTGISLTSVSPTLCPKSPGIDSKLPTNLVQKMDV